MFKRIVAKNKAEFLERTLKKTTENFPDAYDAPRYIFLPEFLSRLHPDSPVYNRFVLGEKSRRWVAYALKLRELLSIYRLKYNKNGRKRFQDMVLGNLLIFEGLDGQGNELLYAHQESCPPSGFRSGLNFNFRVIATDTLDTCREKKQHKTELEYWRAVNYQELYCRNYSQSGDQPNPIKVCSNKSTIDSICSEAQKEF